MTRSIVTKKANKSAKSSRHISSRNLHRGLLAGVSLLAFTLASAPVMALDVIGTVTVGDIGYTKADLDADIINIGMGSDGELTLNNPTYSVQQIPSFYVSIGQGAGKTGTLNITGPGVSWKADNTVDVGFGGNGNLNITSGGQFYSKGGRMGFLAGSKAQTTISGAGSFWDTSTFGFNVGIGGEATINIQAGGALITKSVGTPMLGVNAGGNGAVSITGAGSHWEVGGGYLGLGGAANTKATLTVADGGMLHQGSGNNLTKIVIDPGSLGTVAATVNIGNDSTKSAGFFNVNELAFGTGSNPSSRVLNFTHNDTKLAFGTKLTGLGTINHNAGTTSLTADNTSFKGAINVKGGTLTISGASRIGDSAITIDKGGTLSFAMKGSTFVYGGTFAGEGNFAYNSSGLTITLNGISSSYSGDTTISAGGLVLGNTQALGTSTITMVPGAVLELTTKTDGTFANKLSGKGFFVINDSATITLTPDNSLFTGSSLVTAGKLILGDSKSTGAKLGGTVTIGADAKLSGAGSITNTANVSGHLIGKVGETFNIESLVLNPSATISVTVPEGATKSTSAAFKGSSVNYGNAMITEIILPVGYKLSQKSAEYYVFDYGLRSGSISIANGAKLPYANDKFTIDGIENGYLVLTSTTPPTPDPTPWDGNYPALENPQIWSGVTHKFVDGSAWEGGSAFFINDAKDKPVRVEGFVRIAGLTVNGTNYVFQDAGTSDAPGVFSLRPASGTDSVELSVANAGTATIAIPLGGGNFRKTGAGSLTLSAPSNDFAGTGTIENGTLKLTGGFEKATFAVNNGQLTVDGKANNITVATGGTLSGKGTVGSATIAGSLVGNVGTTFTINSLTLQPTAQVTLNIPADSAAHGVPAFRGDSLALNGEIAKVNLPEDFKVGTTGASFYVFDYATRTGAIKISDNVQQKYAASDFTFGGIEYGYMVLNPKNKPQTSETHTTNASTVTNPFLWSGIKHTFVDGTGWVHDSAQFTGDGSGRPIQVEGRVLVAGLNVDGSNYRFVDSGNRSAPAVFALETSNGAAAVALGVGAGQTTSVEIPVGGTSNFVKEGAGRLTLAADSNEYKGTGTVTSGELFVSGNFSQANFVVGNEQKSSSTSTPSLRVNGQADHVTVNGNGVIDGRSSGLISGAVNIRHLAVNGGTLKPGNSPGTIRLGDLRQTGGFLELEPGDRIEVVSVAANGSQAATEGRAEFARAANGAPVQVTLTNSDNYQFGTPYAFIVAQNGITLTSPGAVTVSGVRTDGTADNRLFTRFAFDVFDGEGSFAQTAAVRTVGAVYLQRDPSRSFSSVALTHNQLAVATALDAQTRNGSNATNTIYNTLVSARADQINDVRVALGQLSGEIHASAQGVLTEESRHLREATLNRTRAALNKRETVSGQAVQKLSGANVALWGQAFGSWGRNDRTQQAAALDRSVGGFVLGADTGLGLDNWRVGFAGGYSRSSIDAKSLPSEANADNYHFALYAGTRIDDLGPGSLGLRFGLGQTWSRLDTKRELNAMGLRDTAQAKYDARTFQIYGEAGYALSFSALMVEPFANLAYVNNHTDGFTETSVTGLTGSALTGASRTIGTGFSTLGVRLSTELETGVGKATLRGGLGWRHAFGDVTPDARFSSLALQAFSVSGSPIAKNALAVEAGVEAAIAEGTTLGVSYNGQIASDTQEHGIRGYLAVRF